MFRPRAIVTALLAGLFVFGARPGFCAEPFWIFGSHDVGGYQRIENAGRRGWLVVTEAVGANRYNYSGGNFTYYADRGHGVIVRLNYGYGSDGTLPPQSMYADFAARCGNYVAATQGADIFIIGNETNLPREWPGNVNGDPNTGEAITADRYVSCYNQCYAAIKNAKPAAQVCPAPSGTWAPPYDGTCGGLPNRGVEGFLAYWLHILNDIGASKIDALALHAYTHGCDPGLVTDTSTMTDCGYGSIYYNFRVYRNYMNAIPGSMRAKPVYITECDQNIECADGGSPPRHTWLNSNNGWVKAIYSEINQWNQVAGNQRIRCVALFRWDDVPEGEWAFGFSVRSGVLADWSEAMANDYRWDTSPTTGSISGYVKDTYNTPISGASISTSPATTTASSGPDGYYVIPAVPAGTYSVTASAANHGPQTNSGVVVVAGQNTASSFSLVPTAGMVDATPGGTNAARQATQWPTDSNYGPDWSGAKAIDGVNEAGSKWCSTNASSTHWLALDLGAVKYVTGFILRHAGSTGELTGYNLKAFKFQSGTSISGPWTDECAVDNSAQANVTRRKYVTPKQLRYVRLYITNCGIDNYARVPEFEVYAGTSPTTPTVTDDGIYQTSTGSIRAAWSASDSTGIAEYQNAVSATQAESGVIPNGGWQSVGTSTSGSRTGLALAPNSAYYVLVKARNNLGIWSAVGVSNGIRVAASCGSLAEAKAHGDGDYVSLSGVQCSRRPSSSLAFVQAANRTSGIRVTAGTGSIPALADGQMCDVIGRLLTVAGLREMTDVAMTAGAAGTASPLGMLGRSVMNSGNDNSGLLVRVWGRVIDDPGEGVFHLDDGSLPDYLPVKLLAGVTAPPRGANVALAGIADPDGLLLVSDGDKTTY